MKIIDVAEFYSVNGGGVRTYIGHKLAAGAQLGCQTVIIAPGPEDRREEANGGVIYWVKSPRIPLDHRYHLFTRSAPIHQILDEERPQVVEGSSPWLGGWAAAKWRGKAARALFIHQDPTSSYPRTLLGPKLGFDRVDRLLGWFWSYLRALSDRFDTTVVASQWLARRLEHYGLRSPSVIPLGISKLDFHGVEPCAETRAAMAKACGLEDPSTPILIAISRHHPEKFVGTMLSGFEAASRHRPIGLFLLGDGPLRARVERRAAGIPGVHVAGQVDDRALLARYMASADAMIHGGGFETYGLVVAEALCSGLPLIVPESGGAGELADTAYSETYRVGDADGCSQAILRLLDRDPALLRAAARAAGEQVPTFDDHFRSLFDLYERTAQGSKKVRQKPLGSEWVSGTTGTYPVPG
ncbi:MAG: glycosyltransferase [Alphaproteobacteria bacterium]|nr:glycosyltransferase [Alphaproteobacteria bacterium]